MAGELKAIFFDCDGVLVDTERDGHRVAFNRAFKDEGLDVDWDVEVYGELLQVAGGKERMRAYFDRFGWPPSARSESDRDAFIKRLHAAKTEHFAELVVRGEMPVRPGILRLVDESISRGIKLLVCSTSNARSVTAIVHHLLGEERERHFTSILAGDVVNAKKPSPEIYRMAIETVGEPATHCVVVEDSRNGLLAAKGAGLACLVTTSSYTTTEDLSEADRVVPDLDNGGDPISISSLVELL